MKFVTYAEQNNSNPRFGFKVEKQIVDVTRAAEWVNQNNGDDTFLSVPGSLKEALADWDHNFSLLKDLEIEVSNGDLEALSQPESDLIILPPIPDPPAFREDDGKLHLRMTCHVNGKKISNGNTNDLYHSFGEMIERASMNTKLVPGEYIGSGTVGTGCILELRPENTGGWIQKGDVVTLAVERLGILENKIV